MQGVSAPKFKGEGGMVELGLLEQSEVGCRKCVALGLAEELWFLLGNSVHVLTFKIYYNADNIFS